MKQEEPTSLEQEMLVAWHKPDSLDQCIYVARNFAQKEKSIVKEIIQLQYDCLENCANFFDPKSPIGAQILITLEKSKSL